MYNIGTVNTTTETSEVIKVTEKEQALVDATIDLYNKNDLEYVERTIANDKNWSELIYKVTIKSELEFWYRAAKELMADYGIDVYSYSKASLTRTARVTASTINSIVDGLLQKYRPGHQAKRMPGSQTS